MRAAERNEEQRGAAESDDVPILQGRRRVDHLVVHVDEAAPLATVNRERAALRIEAHDGMRAPGDRVVAGDADVHRPRSADRIALAANAIVAPAIRTLDADEPADHRIDAELALHHADRLGA